MEVNNTTAPLTITPASTNGAQAAAVLSSDFETFLQMLTAQARFQDPLEPIDSSEYAAQLAQFSMVEQQVQSNELLRFLGAQLGQSTIGQMASWIGLEARTSVSVPFDGDPITVFTEPDTVAEEAFLIAYGPDGAEVQRTQIPAGTREFEWLGIADGGAFLPLGNYNFVVESRTAGKTTSTIPAETFARITEARSVDGTSSFMLKGGSIVTAEQVVALREPAAQVSSSLNNL